MTEIILMSLSAVWALSTLSTFIRIKKDKEDYKRITSKTSYSELEADTSLNPENRFMNFFEMVWSILRPSPLEKEIKETRRNIRQLKRQKQTIALLEKVEYEEQRLLEEMEMSEQARERTKPVKFRGVDPIPYLKAQKTKESSNPIMLYQIRSGDTFSGIAYRFKMTTEQLRKLNNLKSVDELRVGHMLVVYSKYANHRPTERKQDQHRKSGNHRDVTVYNGYRICAECQRWHKSRYFIREAMLHYCSDECLKKRYKSKNRTGI